MVKPTPPEDMVAPPLEYGQCDSSENYASASLELASRPSAKLTPVLCDGEAIDQDPTLWQCDHCGRVYPYRAPTP